MVPLPSHKVSRVSWYSGYCRPDSDFRYGAFTLSGRLSQNRSPVLIRYLCAVLTPRCTHHGLGSFPFARRYSGNRCFFLFLRLLRCFSSPGSLRTPMDSVHGDRSLSCRVSPFRNRWVAGYLLLSSAYRSLSRLSSALSAKASTLRSFLLNLSSAFSHFPLCIALQVLVRLVLCMLSHAFCFLPHGLPCGLGCLEYFLKVCFKFFSDVSCVVFKVQ